ncbi:MAG: hypothetical protein WCQ65_12765 [Fermentimonas sp.]
MPVSASFDPVRPNKEAWTCYDYSINYSECNPEWGVVTMSNHPHFHGYSHVVNYQYVNNNTLRIHDGLYNLDYNYTGWQYNGYYHFWPDGSIPKRTFIRLLDNRYLLINDVV